MKQNLVRALILHFIYLKSSQQFLSETVDFQVIQAALWFQVPLGLSLLAFLLLSLEKAGRIKSMFFSFKKLSLPLVLEKEVAVSYLLMKRIYFTFCSI